MLGDNGIITKAKQSSGNYLVAANEEQQILKDVEEEIEDITTGITKLRKDINLGDYIKYDTGNTNIGDNGVVVCRVLYNDTTNGLQIMTDEPITQKVDGVDSYVQVELSGSDWETAKEVYNNGIQLLNEEASKYVNSNSDYVLDARCVGSLPMIGEDGKFSEKNNGSTNTVEIPTYFALPSGWTSTDTGCYEGDTNYIYDEKVMQDFNMKYIDSDENSSYWLASRQIKQDTGSRIEFDMRAVSSGRSASYSSDPNICRVLDKFYFNSGQQADNGYSLTRGIRPCFSIKSDINITGDGQTVDTAYVIQ